MTESEWTRKSITTMCQVDNKTDDTLLQLSRAVLIKKKKKFLGNNEKFDEGIRNDRVKLFELWTSVPRGKAFAYKGVPYTRNSKGSYLTTFAKRTLKEWRMWVVIGTSRSSFWYFLCAWNARVQFILFTNKIREISGKGIIYKLLSLFQTSYITNFFRNCIRQFLFLKNSLQSLTC